MLFRKALWAFTVVAGLLTPMAVRAQGDHDYLDVYIVKVKPEKIAEFEALNKKWADANRRFHGDTWLALESVYGEGNVYQFTSTRKDYAEVQTVEDLQMAALTKAFGKQAALKMDQDFQNCLVWSRAELRRRRWDLSRKPPAEADAYSKLIGESRYLRTTAVHIRAGHVADFEALLKDLKEAGERNPNTAPVFISQVVEGGKGTTFYVSTLRSSLGGFDRNPTTREILGDEGYKKYLQTNADIVETTESTLYRFSPELSNPPEEVAKVAANFWRPKSAGAASASATKPNSAAVQPTAAKDPVKKP
jgi:hypothetical protein